MDRQFAGYRLAQAQPDHPVSALLHPPRKEPFLKLVATLGEIAAGSDPLLASWRGLDFAPTE